MADNPEQIIRNFCAAFANLDADEVMGYFVEDGPTYHNMPGPPATGSDAVRALVEGFLGRWDKTDWQLVNIASSGNVVFAERLDVTDEGGKHVDLPCVGVFELNDDGKIVTWRDYFDINTYMTAMAPAG
jgi:limonene-1,2-epoxide hydrolase